MIGNFVDLSADDVYLAPRNFQLAGADRLVDSGLQRIVNLATGLVSPFVSGLTMHRGFYHPGRNSIFYVELGDGQSNPRVLERVIGTTTDTEVGRAYGTMAFDSSDGSFIARPQIDGDLVLYSPKLATGRLNLGIKSGWFLRNARKMLVVEIREDTPGVVTYAPYIMDFAAPAAPTRCVANSNSPADGGFLGGMNQYEFNAVVNANCTDMLYFTGNATVTDPPTPYTLSFSKLNLVNGTIQAIQQYNSDGVDRNPLFGMLSSLGQDFYFVVNRRLYRQAAAGAPTDLGAVSSIGLNYNLMPSELLQSELGVKQEGGFRFVVSSAVGRAYRFTEPKALLSPLSTTLKSDKNNRVVRVSREQSRDEATSETLLVQYFDSNGNVSRTERIATGLLSTSIGPPLPQVDKSDFVHLYVSGTLNGQERRMAIAFNLANSTSRSFLLPVVSIIGGQQMETGLPNGDILFSTGVCSMLLSRCGEDLVVGRDGELTQVVASVGADVLAYMTNQTGSQLRRLVYNSATGVYSAGATYTGQRFFLNGSKTKLYAFDSTVPTWFRIDLTNGNRMDISGMNGMLLKTFPDFVLLGAAGNARSLQILDFATDTVSTLAGSTYSGYPTLYPNVVMGDYTFVHTIPMDNNSPQESVVLNHKTKTVVGKYQTPAGVQHSIIGQLDGQFLINKSAPANSNVRPGTVLLSPQTLAESVIDLDGLQSVAWVTNAEHRILMAQGHDASFRQISAYLKPSISMKLFRFKTHDAGIGLRQVIDFSPTKLLVGTTLLESDYQYGIPYYPSSMAIEPGSRWTLVTAP